jgi:hypothetical protein
MATDAVARRVVRLERPVNPSWDRGFFVGMTFLLWTVVVWGFAKTYFLAGMVAAPLPNALIHLHGAVFTLWMMLLAVQVGLVSAGKLKWHKQLGLGGFGLAVLMLVLGILAATDSLRRGGDGNSGLGAKTFYVIPVSGIIAFAGLVYLAYRARSKPAVHKRLILIATIGISEAAIARWPVEILHDKPQLRLVVILTFLLMVVVYDMVSLKRVHKATLWASAFVMFVMLVRIPIAMSPPWQAFATLMGGKS